jgi:hypothetical protein
MYRQFQLRSDDRRMICWLYADDARVKPGALVRLKGDTENKWWEILEAFTTRLDAPPEKRWRVGGLL